MIASVVSQVTSGDVTWFSVKVLGLVLLGRIVWVTIDLAIARMQHHQAQDERARAIWLANAGREVPQTAPRLPDIPESEEPSWPGKASLLRVVEPVTSDDVPTHYDLAAVLVNNGLLPEAEAETSGRHARVEGSDDETGLLAAVEPEPAVVDGPRALASVAAVSGEDGAA